MEPNHDGDGHAGKIDEGESPCKADAGMVRTNRRGGTEEVDRSIEEGEQGGEANPTEDVKDEPATAGDTSVAVAQERKSVEAPNTDPPRKEGLDAAHLRTE